MAIEAELADGRILEFPDGTKPEVIQATVKKVLGIQAAPAPAAESFTTGDPMGVDFGAALAQVPAKPTPKYKVSPLDMPAPEGEQLPFTEEEGLLLSKKAIAEGKGLTKPPPEARPSPLPLPKRTAMEINADIWAGILQGGVGFFKGITDNIAAGENPASEALDVIDQGLEKYFKSPQLKEQAAKRQMYIDAIQRNQGELAAASASMRTMLSPAGADIIARGAGSIVPTVGLSLLGLGAKSLAASNMLSTGGESARQAAEMLRKSDPKLWEENTAYQALRANGLSHKDATALLVPLYALPAQATGAAAGYASGRLGLEKTLTGKELDRSVRARATRALEEQLGEQLETVAPQVVTNLTAGAMGAPTSAFEGLGQAITETAAGTLPGSALAARAPRRVEAKPPTAEAPLVPPVAPPVAPVTPAAEAQVQPPVAPAAAPMAAPEAEAPAPAAPAVPTAIDEERLAKLVASGVPEEDARAMLGAPTEPTEAAAPVEDKGRVRDLADDYVASGLDPAAARDLAIKQVQREEAADKEAATEGAPSAVQTVTEPSGAGVSVAGVPGAEPTAAGVGGAEPTGVVRSSEDVGQVAGREAAAPGAVAREGYWRPNPREPENKQSWQDTSGAVHWDVNYPLPDGGRVKEIQDQMQAGRIVLVLDNAGGQERVVQVSFDGVKKPFWNAGDKVSDEALRRGLGDNLYNAIGAERIANTEQYEALLSRIRSVLGTPTAELTPQAPTVKRGRPATIVTPEQKASAEERRKQQRLTANAASRQVAALEAKLNEALTPVDPESVSSEEELTNAVADKRRAKVAAMAALYDFSKSNRNKPGQRAAELLKNPAITAAELEAVKAGHEARKQAAAKVAPSQLGESKGIGPVESRLAKVTNGAQAISAIIRTGSLFQKLLALRIRGFVNNVKIVVLEKGDPLPEALTKGYAAKEWPNSRGLFVYDDATGTRTVYLRGESEGNDQGVNNATVLHELLHAATVQKLYLAQRALERGFSTDANLTRAYQDLVRVMRVAQEQFIALGNKNSARVYEIWQSTNGAVFSDPKEFLAYGLTDPYIQRFLMQTEDVAPAQRMFSRFVDAIRRFFNLAADQHTALSNLVDVTDKILSARKTEDMRLLEKLEGEAARKAGAAPAKVAAAAKEEEVKARPSANVQRLSKMLGSKLYGTPKDIASVSIKELFQNSFDAIKGALERGDIAKGKIDINLDEVARTITIVDNGLGMPTSVMGHQFLQIAGTVKETTRASGGLGVAKMLFLFENKRLEVVSLRDGVVSRMVTNGDDLKAALDDPERAPTIQVSSDPDVVAKYVKSLFPDGHGTAITVNIPESYIDASTGDTEKIPFYVNSLATRTPALRFSPLFDDIEVNTTIKYDYGYDAKETLPIGANFPINEYTPFANVNFAWGTARIYVSKNKREDTHGENTHVLSNGLWQFNTNIKDRPGFGGNSIPRDFYIDVSPAENVKPEDAGYPFDLNRQGFSKAVNQDFSKIFNYITAIYSQIDLAEGVKNFGTVQYINNDGTLTAPETLEPRAPLSENAFTLIKPTDKVEVRDGVLYVNNRALPELTKEDLEKTSIRIDELTIPQEEIDPNKVMVHDNTTVPEKEDKSLSELAREKFGSRRYDEYLAGVGNTFHLLRQALIYADESYTTLADEAFGVSIDNKYYGVSIKLPFSGMFINPATTNLKANPAQVAVSMLGTMIHEMAHYKVRNHGAEFASEMQKINTILDTHPFFDLQDLKKSLIQHINNNFDIFQYLDEEFNSGNVKPRGNRFKEASYQQIGDEGTPEPMESARGAGEGRPGLSEVAGEGVAGAGKVGVGAGVSGKAAQAGTTESEDDLAKKAASDQRKLDNRVDAAITKFEASDRATQAAENATLLKSLRSGEDFIRYVNTVFKSIDKARLSAMLFNLPTDVVASWGESNGVRNLNKLNDLIGRMHGLSRQLLVAAGKVNENMVRAIKAEPELRRKLEKIAYVSTIARVDPSVNKASAELNKLWDSLGDQGQRIYKELRSYYENMVDYYGHLLDQQINTSKLDPEAKKTLMAAIKQMYEVDKRIVPFFPLVRNQGELWLSFGKRNKRQFIMFKNEAQRAAVLDMLAKREEQTIDEFIADNDVKQGDTVESFRSHAVEASDMLRKVFEKLDAAKTLDANAVDKLKDSIYDLYLTTLPDQSFRRGFITRKDVIGFNTDLVRNFSTTATRMATQLARIKYGPELRNALTAAEGSLEKNPDEAKLMRFVDEMKRRVDMELNPYGERVRGISRAAMRVIEGIGNSLSRLAFVHFMSAAGSALVQLTSTLYGAANLGARHGYTKTAIELAKLMKFWDEFGIRQNNADGTVSFVAPTMAESKRVSLNADEQRAVNEMLGRGVSEITLTNEMLGRAQVPSAEYQSGVNKAKRVFWTAVGGLFHTAERISREVIFMTSYRLSRSEGKSHEEAVDQAVADTYDSVGNMSQWNRPPIMRGPTGRVATQFLMYPLFMTARLASTFVKMLPLLNKEGKTQALKEFGGIMGVTWMLAGVAGLPTFSIVMGIIGAAFRAMDDKDKPEDLKKINFELWFRTVFMPELLGKTKVFGKDLSDIIMRGPANAFTGLDIAGRTSLNDLWFRDSKETRTPREGAVNTAIEHAGPAANMILSYLDAYQAVADGDNQKAAEKALPSILRGPTMALKYMHEGAKDFRGAQILSKDAFTTGDLFFQAIGLRSDPLANHQKVLFDMAKIENGIRFNRENIINNIADAYAKADEKRFRDKLGEMQKFNAKYPTFGIDTDAIERAIETRGKRAAESIRGFTPTEKNIQLLGPAVQQSLKALEEKEKSARK